MTGALLELRQVSRHYKIRCAWLGPARILRAVDDVSLDIRQGEVLGIIGESGSGKTTLGRLILGLTRPTEGEIRLDGQIVAEVGRRTRARRIQPVFQDPYSSLNPRQTVEQIIAMPLKVHGIGDAAQHRRAARETMDKVGLSKRLVHAYPSQLSGGQRQRVAIARALITKPEILVCDEPTSALDVSVQGQILNLMKDLQQSLGLTYVFITHDLAIIEYLADRVAVMYLGRLVESGPTREVMANPRHPYTQALRGAILTPDPLQGLPDLHLGRGFPDPLDPPPGCPFHPRCPDAMPVCRERAPAETRGTDGFVTCHLHEPAMVSGARGPEAAGEQVQGGVHAE